MGYGSITEIARYCFKLKSLTVEYEIGEDSILALSKYCPLLTELNIPLIPRITTEQSATICAPVLSCIYSITTSTYGKTYEYNYSTVVPYLTELRDLKAQSSNDHVLLPLFSQYCLKLESFQIDDFSNATSTQVLQLVQNCIHLHTINITNKDLFKDEFIIVLTKRCPNLHKLYYYGEFFNNTCLIALSENCPKLQEVILYNCTIIIEDFVLNLIKQCKQLFRLVQPDIVLDEDTIFEVPVKMQRRDKNNCTIFTFVR